MDHETVRACIPRLMALVLGTWAALSFAQELSPTSPPPTAPGWSPRVAVLRYRNRTEVDSLNVFEDLIRQAICNRLASTGRVTLVPYDEVAAALDTIAPEMGYLTNERQAYRLGQAVGAQKVVFGSFFFSGDVVTIRTYVVDAQSMTVHIVEQPEPRMQVGSDQVAVETARVVQGEVAGVMPVGPAPTRTQVERAPAVASSPALHPQPWLALAATAGLGYLTFHYHDKSSETWDEYQRAVREHEITRLYSKSTDYLLARNVCGILTAVAAGMSVHYWFAHDFGAKEQWASGSGGGRWKPLASIDLTSVRLGIGRSW